MSKIKEVYFGGTKTAGFNKIKSDYKCLLTDIQSQQQASRESRISNITLEHFNTFIFTMGKCFLSKCTRNLWFLVGLYPEL